MALSLFSGWVLSLLKLSPKKRKTISIYKSMGLRLGLIKKGLFFSKFSFIVPELSFLSVVLSFGINHIGEELLGPYLTNPIDVKLSLPGLSLGLVILVIIYWVIIKPLLNKFIHQKAGQLFQENSAWNKKEDSRPLKTFLLLIPVLFILTFFLSGSWKLSLGFLSAILDWRSINQFIFKSVLSLPPKA